EQHDPGEDQTRVVAERTSRLRRGRPRRRARAFRRRRSDGGGHGYPKDPATLFFFVVSCVRGWLTVVHSLTFNRSFSSLMNSPRSRKWRYTDAKRTYATLSSFLSSSMTKLPMSAVAISFSGRSCNVASTRSATPSSAATLTGRFSHALRRP